MEIITAPYRRASSPWRRVLLLVAVLAPVTLLALLPTGLGLERYVIAGDSMAPAIDRGSVVLERDVPVSDLRVGDVVTFHPPSDFRVTGPVTSRIVTLEAGMARTQADARPQPDPWSLVFDEPTQRRVVLALPYVGYPYLALAPPGTRTGLAVTLVCALGLALAVGHRRPRTGRSA
jgi:signal peptidase I